MDSLKRARRPIRREIRALCCEILKLAAKEKPDKDLIGAHHKLLDDQHAFLLTYNERIAQQLVDDGAPDEDQDIEYDECRELNLKYLEAKRVAGKITVKRQTSPAASERSTSSGGRRRNANLPKIQIPVFSGEFKDWIGWWAQFSIIHDDDELNPADKFTFLTQAMIDDSRAKDVVKIYPPSAENYPKAIKALQDRFGKEEILIDVYVRELLSLINQNTLSKVKGTKDHVSLSKLYDQLESHLRALETLGVTTDDKVAHFLYPMVESCLPIPVLRAWQRSSHRKSDGENTKLQRLMSFLADEVEGETLINLASQGFGTSEEKCAKKESEPYKGNKPRKDKPYDQLPTAMALVTLDDAAKCAFCDRNHKSQDCWTAQKLSLEEKMKRLQEKKRCFKCFGIGHLSRECSENVFCSLCGKRHYQIVCNLTEGNDSANISITPGSSDSFAQVKPKRETNNSNEMSQANLTCNTMLLPTLVVGVRGRDGKVKRARAAIDTLSGHSYIRKGLVEELKLIPNQRAIFNHAVFGGKVVEAQHLKYHITLETLNGTFTCSTDVFDQKQISAGIPMTAKGNVAQELQEYGIFLGENKQASKELDLLLGADIAGKILTGRILQLKTGPTAVETRFGWTVMGKTTSLPLSDQTKILVHSMINMHSPTMFWDLEAVGIMDPAEKLSKLEEDAIALDYFRSTVTRTVTGRYCVRLPWIENHPPLPTNRNVAEKRLESALRKLKSEEKLADYDNVFKEWENMHIIEKVPVEEMERECHYLPHRPVFKPESNTTKVRPVFDASCKPGPVSNSELPSLNDCLVKGPNTLEKIPDLLLRFRENKVAAVADIKKAFLMIEIDKRDRDYLRFLWIDQEGRRNIFRHCRVVFGVNCSPFLLSAVIEHHLLTATAHDENEIVDKLLLSLYVDNVAASFPTKDKLKEFKEKSVDILADAKFDLRLWESNTDEDVSAEPTGVLGILWNKKTDSLALNLKFDDFLPDKVTKKSMLSAIARVFDPIGMLAPVILVSKLLMQECWSLKLKWDDEVPENLKSRFVKWMEQMQLASLTSGACIPRCICVPDEGSSVHVFCDASELGYATVAFLRLRTGEISFLMARSRVAPLGKTTINRLELVSCEIAARLGRKIKDALKWNHVPFHYWTDSTTAKAWIIRNSDWGTFVGNRVRKILALTEKENWRHVPGVLNPADLPSRGCGMKELLQSNWWKGPEWLALDPPFWPKESVNEDEDEISSEVKKSSICTVSVPVPEPWYSSNVCTISNYSALIRVMGYVLRFIGNVRNKGARMTGPLTRKEIMCAEKKLLWQVQKESDIDVNSLPFKTIDDENGLMRVETKLAYRQDDEFFKWPIVIPGKHRVAQLLIREVHQENCHAGVQVVLGKLREKVWITRARRAVETVIKNCVICKRFKVDHPEPRVAALPENRVRDAAPFEITGIDYAGPLYLKKKKKVWIALFTCAVYRAVHLELVTSLSTEAFLMSLRRFAARRGRPAVIYTDNGTNFTGAQRLLKALDWKKITEDTGVEPIQWVFSPPSAPWWGGWWERLVRTMKELLFRVLGKQVLNMEELTTILYDVEAVINDRPLTHIFEGDTLVALTPALFLRGPRVSGMPDVENLCQSGFQRRHSLKQRLMKDLQQRFRREYLGQLVQKKKDERNSELRTGDVVLIGADNKKRFLWPTGVIQEILPGRDGVVRVAKVRTNHGTLLRPVQRLYPLEISSPMRNEIPDAAVEKVRKTKSGRIVKEPDYLRF